MKAVVGTTMYSMSCVCLKIPRYIVMPSTVTSQTVPPLDKLSDNDMLDPFVYLQVCQRNEIRDRHRLAMLRQRWVPTECFTYPKRQSRGYVPTWEQQYTWLRYSPLLNGMFCSACNFFTTFFVSNDYCVIFLIWVTV